MDFNLPSPIPQKQGSSFIQENNPKRPTGKFAVNSLFYKNKGEMPERVDGKNDVNYFTPAQPGFILYPIDITSFSNVPSIGYSMARGKKSARDLISFAVKTS
jgi:hypothetical protein